MRTVLQPGRLKCVQGIGWWLEEANIAQVSMNLGDLEVTPMHVAFEECVKDANVSRNNLDDIKALST